MIIVGFEKDNLVGITVHYEIGAVRSDNDLSSSFKSPQCGQNVLINKTVVQLVLRLIDDQRTVIVGFQQ